MKRYEIRKNYREMKDWEGIKPGCTLDQGDQEPEILKSFEDKAEALEALKSYTGKAEKLSGGAGTFYAVTEFYVEENDYDEDGEWCDGGDVWGFAEIEK